MNELLSLSATALARAIRDRRASSREVVEAHIDRVREVNPRLNALVHDRYNEARAEALAADERLAREGPEGLPPLHGVPCTIKEAIALKGMPHTSGLVARRGVLATRDAPTVARLRAAGAIPLGVTNTSELCMWMESSNRVYGRTGNAYDPARTAGGSSGGEGAMVGAGAAPFGLGSDIGGSIRMPAFFNGVFGHKATGGLIPGTGNFPSPHGDAWRLLATGPLCRRAEDLPLLVGILLGPDGEDPGCEPGTLGDCAGVRASDLTVYDCRERLVLPVETALLDAQERAARALERRGARVERAQLPKLRAALELWSARMHAAGGPSYAELLGEGTPVNPAREFGKWLLGRSEHTLPSLGLAAVEKVPALFPERVARNVERARALQGELRELLGASGVLLFPSHTRPAPRHHHPFLPPVHWGYTSIFNVLEAPATQVPLGLDPRGLPLGVQVVAGHGRDHLGLAVARWLEEDLGGWVCP